jgi:DNA excision repair protein ERCC-2
LYEALLAVADPNLLQFRIRLVYCHPDTLATCEYEDVRSRREVLRVLRQGLTQLGDWYADQQRHLARRDAYLQKLPFPFPEFRPHQRALAGTVYTHLAQGSALLLEAPTGSGKTSGVLFPALRVLGARHRRRIFYLTSRATGAAAVWDAVSRHDPGGDRLRVLRIVAKEKACPVPGMPCGPESCTYARDYFARLPAARAALLAAPRMTEAAVAATARAHRVCPFELSLDVALWSDLVIADYNYLLDPLVRLQRFADGGADLVLIDEAHQLDARVRGMLSARLDRAQVHKALAQAPAGSLRRALRGLDRLLLSLRRAAVASDGQRLDYAPRLTEKLTGLQEALAEVQLPLEDFPELRAVWFDAVRWTRAAAVQEHGDMTLVFEPRDPAGAVCVNLVCVDPAPYLRALWTAFPAHVRFSGTLAPLSLFAEMHGAGSANRVRIANAYGRDQLGVWVVPDIPTHYRRRQTYLARTAQLVRDVVAAAPGRYLLALPSFAYLQLLMDELQHETEADAAPPVRWLQQQPGMDDGAQQSFLEAMACADASPEGAAATVVAGVVLGGLFGESVDFAGIRLRGVICIGPGLPPPDPARRAREARLQHLGVTARTRVYTQPAMTNVVQMAGRVLRSPEDRGILCLVDPRFNEPEYRQFFPEHWQPRCVAAKDLRGALANFWRRR